MVGRLGDRVWDGVLGGVVGGIVSGAPSTLHALATGGGVLTAARAAGALLGKPGLARGVVAHGGISIGWGAVLGATLPRRRTAAVGAVAGLVIAALDLGVVGRRIPPIASLPQGPQVHDHVVFGAVVGATVAGRRTRAGDQPTVASASASSRSTAAVCVAS